MNRRLGIPVVAAFIASMLMASGAREASAQSGTGGRQLSPIQKRILSGFASFVLDPNSVLGRGPQQTAAPSAFHPLGQAAQAVSGLDPPGLANHYPGGPRD